MCWSLIARRALGFHKCGVRCPGRCIVHRFRSHQHATSIHHHERDCYPKLSGRRQCIISDKLRSMIGDVFDGFEIIVHRNLRLGDKRLFRLAHLAKMILTGAGMKKPPKGRPCCSVLVPSAELHSPDTRSYHALARQVANGGAKAQMVKARMSPDFSVKPSRSTISKLPGSDRPLSVAFLSLGLREQQRKVGDNSRDGVMAIYAKTGAGSKPYAIAVSSIHVAVAFQAI
jgi:hypothetical protein